MLQPETLNESEYSLTALRMSHFYLWWWILQKQPCNWKAWVHSASGGSERNGSAGRLHWAALRCQCVKGMNVKQDVPGWERACSASLVWINNGWRKHNDNIKTCVHIPFPTHVAADCSLSSRPAVPSGPPILPRLPLVCLAVKLGITYALWWVVSLLSKAIHILYDSLARGELTRRHHYRQFTN